MRIALALLALSAAACSTTECERCHRDEPRTAYIFVDSDGDGLPDQRGFGFTSFGVSSFADTDDDGLPDTRLVELPARPSRAHADDRADERLERALDGLEQAVTELRQALRRR